MEKFVRRERERERKLKKNRDLIGIWLLNWIKLYVFDPFSRENRKENKKKIKSKKLETALT